jgi:hypothetical protein
MSQGNIVPGSGEKCDTKADRSTGGAWTLSGARRFLLDEIAQKTLLTRIAEVRDQFIHTGSEHQRGLRA